MQIVNQGVLVLRQIGELYRPTADRPLPTVEEINRYKLEELMRISSHCRALLLPKFGVKSLALLYVERLSVLDDSSPLDLALVGRNFAGAIRCANETDLVTRGPLDLRATGVIPPQIVLDNKGLLAVFIGRGCGPTKDVNFFRPTNGGDTQVDVNDVHDLLQPVMDQRKAEDTWQVDSFSDSNAPARIPDEAIVFCLDLSASMRKHSGVSSSKGNTSSASTFYDHDTESYKVLDGLVEGVDGDVVLNHAKEYLNKQHRSCIQAWKASLSKEEGFIFNRSRKLSIHTVLAELATLARREVLTSSLEADWARSKSWPTPQTTELAHFAYTVKHQSDAIAGHLSKIIDEMEDSQETEDSAYFVPEKLIDPKTGDLLLDPVRPNSKARSPPVFVNTDSKEWFEEHSVLPSFNGSPIVSFSSISDVKKAVSRWVSGVDILPSRRMSILWTSNKLGSDIQVTLTHDGRTTVWDLTITTTTRTLYCLANRATEGKYCSFTLRLSSSKDPIRDSEDLPIGETDLSHGGEIEMSRTVPHKRARRGVTVKFGVNGRVQKILLPKGAPILALVSCLDRSRTRGISGVRLWYDINSVGDGSRTGTMVNTGGNIDSYGSGSTLEFECYDWAWAPVGAQYMQDQSRYLSRLDLMKALFNVFIDRACSFDTSVSLALGLVTFSDSASVKQQLTVNFERFKRQVESVEGKGDTVVYDALDTARSLLAAYHPDLPNLRRRIIIVSDGEDTGSKVSAAHVCRALQKDGIIVDAVQVGTVAAPELHAISVATGGYRFFPQASLSNALSIFDLETMLASAERISRPIEPFVSDTGLRDYTDFAKHPIDAVTISQFPPRAAHKKLQMSVKPAANVASSYTYDIRTRRIMRELKELTMDPHPQIDLYVSDSDISFIKIILEAPKDEDGCPYRGGTFLLTCDLPQEYPRSPPEIRFVTFILHPNVSKQGKVCIAQLGRLWSSDLTLKEIFSIIYSLLLEPDLTNPIEVQASLKYYEDDGTYALAAASAVEEHASKTREQWRQELLSEEAGNNLL